MKFGNGCWLQKEGIECFAPQEAYFVNKNDHEVVICAPTHHIAQRRYPWWNQPYDQGHSTGGRRDPCADKPLSGSGRSQPEI